MKYNRICQILGIEKPVIQGPLSWLTDAGLVAAVSNAGGLGVLGPNAGLTAETAVSTPEETAENFDEGGTLPGTALGTFSIVPLIADSVKSVPVMAAGGITDSRTARAAHALGAEGVFAGSVFIGTEESRVPQSVKDKIINANGLDLLLFRTLPDYYRSLPGKLADKLVSMDKAGASNEELAQTMGGLRGLRIGMLEGNTDEGYIALGTGIGNIRSIKSVAEVVNELAIC
ncbi:hypothetical protein BWA46_00545 [Salmonella enterica]|nr:hypothetical protein [Salmonella enterica]EBC2925501.1 hypothetical protein [Salmonella enterica]